MIVIILYPGGTSHLTLATTGLEKDKNIYISLFPATFTSKADFRLHRLEDDASHKASHIVVLPTQESCGYGLSEAAIYAWWKDKFIPKKESFGWIDNNCSTLVYRALIEGQRGVISLENKFIAKKNWISTPGNICEYAEKLGKTLTANKSNEQGLFLAFAQIQEIARSNKISPYEATIALYSRLKDNTTDKLNIPLAIEFCIGVNVALSTLTIDNADLEQLEKLDKPDIDLHFAALSKLVNSIYSNPVNSEEKMRQLEQSLINELLMPINERLKQYSPQLLIAGTDIKKTLQLVRLTLNDDKNPHAKHFQKSDFDDNSTGIGIGRML